MFLVNVSVLGCGRWGTFLAWYAQKSGHTVKLWGRSGSKKFQQLCETRQNEYLKLPDTVVLENSLVEAVRHGEIIIISISAQALRTFGKQLAELADLQEKTFVLCMKGLEKNTGKRLSNVLLEEIGSDKRVAVWVGPGHVQDFTKEIPNCMVIGAADPAIAEYVVDSLNSQLIRFYYGQDMIGMEIGAAAKNVIGIAAGMLDGLKYTSLKGALMARGTKELSRLIQVLGGDAMTVYGLSHLGDYEATLFSAHSNNRQFGEGFVQGEQFAKLAEGVSTVEAIVCLAERYQVDMPICQAVYDIVIKGKEPKQELLNLFLRPVKNE